MVHYDEIGLLFDSSGPAAGLDALARAAEEDKDYHALFRTLLLKKRFEMGLPLINPGDLKGIPADQRRAYEDFVEKTCREIGQKYLAEGNIAQAWRYFRTIGDPEPIKAAIDKLPARDASEEVLTIAVNNGVSPRRGFEMTLEAHGLCRAISTFEQEFSIDLADKRYAADLLVRALYKDLVDGVRNAIHGRFGDFPPETDLIELIRHRPWLFEHHSTHADPQHCASVARIGLLCEQRKDLLLCLAIAEYGRMLSKEVQPYIRPPFDDGFTDLARFARALLGQNVEATCQHFRAKLPLYADDHENTLPGELTVMLYWRVGKKEEALDVWQQYLAHQAPEVPGRYIPSFYELCVQAGSFRRLTESAQLINDCTAWASARILETAKAAPKPTDVAEPAS